MAKKKPKTKQSTKSPSKSLIKKEPKLAKKAVKKVESAKTPKLTVATQLSQAVTKPLDNIKKKLIEQRAMRAANQVLNGNGEAKNPFELGSDSFNFDNNQFDDEETLTDDLFAPGTTQNGLSAHSEVHDALDFGHQEDPNARGGFQHIGHGLLDIGMEIFKKYNDICTKAGDLCKFRIYKNNEFIRTISGPYSWEQLQKDLGPGQYRVQAYSASSGKILRTETQMIGEDPALAMSSPQNQAINIEVEKMRLENERLKSEREAMRLEKEAAIEAARWDRKEKRDEDANIAKLAIGMMQAQNKPDNSKTEIMQIIVDMQKSNFEMMKEHRNDTAKMMEALAKLVIDSKPKSEVTMLDLVKAQQESFEKGKAEERRIQELVEAKAEELAEKLADNDAPAEKDSLTETLVKAFAPVMANALTQPRPSPQSQQLSGPRRQQPRQHPKSLMPDPNPGVVVPPGTPGAPSAKMETSNVVTMPRANLQELNKPLDQDSEENAEPVSDTVDKSPNIHLNGSSELKKTVDGTSHLSQDEAGVEEMAIRDLAIPVIADRLVNGIDPIVAASDILVELQKSGVTAKEVVKHWSLSKLITYAQSLGVPPEANPWFEAFFNEIENIAKKPGASEISEAHL